MKHVRIIKDLPEGSVKSVHLRGGDGIVSVADDKERGMVAVRFEKKSHSGYACSREYVLNLKDQKLTVRSEVKCSVFDADDIVNEKSVVPWLVRDLVRGGYLRDDGELSFSEKPIVIQEKDICKINGLLKGETHCCCPVVCIIPSVFGQLPVDVEQLARYLCGVAHVLVLENWRVYRTLRKRYPEFGEAERGAAIIYPFRNAVSFCGVDGFKKDRKYWMEQLVHAVISGVTMDRMKMADVQETYAEIAHKLLQEQTGTSRQACREARLAQKLAEVKYSEVMLHLDEEAKRLRKEAMENALQEAEQIVSAYEEEIDGLKNDLYEKDLTLRGLEIENERFRRNIDTKGIPVLYLGKEREVYVGEIQDMILSVLEDALQGASDSSRKKDILTDILAANSYKRIGKSRNEQIKQLMKGYQGMTSKIQQGLEALGFHVEKTNKHYKVTYNGDNRYLVVLGSTPSDFRSGRNDATILARVAY